MRINVLKPFVFSTAVDDARLPVERRFTVGEHDIDEQTAAHPWIRPPCLAEGRIESDEQRRARLTAAEEKAAKARVDDARIQLQAEQAFQRAQASARSRNDAGLRTQAELNTPQPSAASPGIRSPMSEELRQELNTPVNVLQARQRGESVSVAVTGEPAATATGSAAGGRSRPRGRR